LEKMAGVEVDGPVHWTTAERKHDRLREEHLGRMGIRILRIEAGRIENDLPSVQNDIREFLVL
jgi:very-short-patch-repair endonuclease